LGDIAQRRGVGQVGVEDLGEVVGRDGVAVAATAGFDLGEGLPDGDEQDTDTGESGGVFGRGSQRGLAGLVDDHQQQGVEGAAGGGDAPVGLGDEVVEQSPERGCEARWSSMGAHR
jgi:hypothetical protein